ncbi:Sigma factor SigB regulation protein RsbQ [Planococcus massiliensis]|uniref:Sigma factor SigB regulation protein RsbQ n=1 Tax=Planococcus massiliensis TaxID=1499687 RepID=A0A098EID0_9BACL|nr:alpha/beta hydrolase [Planococcus massiliensis]CEG21562.1 Sigma factor SigB regulation protein RsbQ [Planococcus massiliensis]
MREEIIKRNNVRIIGEGKQTLVFAHGFGCDQYVWNQVAPAFENKYRIVLFDYVGSGKSDKSKYSTERYSTLHGYKQDLLDLCDALNLRNVVFVGHSVSSMIGILASNERPELITKLIMIAPSPYYLNEGDYQGGFEPADIDELLDMMEVNYKEWAKYLAPVVMQNPDRPALTTDFEGILSSNDPVIARQFAEVTFKSDMRGELGKVRVPALILQTQFDAIAPIEVGRYVHAHIENSKFIIMDAKGHNPHLSDVEETVAHIQQYLNE